MESVAYMSVNHMCCSCYKDYNPSTSTSTDLKYDLCNDCIIYHTIDYTIPFEKSFTSIYNSYFYRYRDRYFNLFINSLSMTSKEIDNIIFGMIYTTYWGESWEQSSAAYLFADKLKMLHNYFKTTIETGHENNETEPVNDSDDTDTDSADTEPVNDSDTDTEPVNDSDTDTEPVNDSDTDTEPVNDTDTEQHVNDTYTEHVNDTYTEPVNDTDTEPEITDTDTENKDHVVDKQYLEMCHKKSCCGPYRSGSYISDCTHIPQVTGSFEEELHRRFLCENRRGVKLHKIVKWYNTNMNFFDLCKLINLSNQSPSQTYNCQILIDDIYKLAQRQRSTN